MDYKETTEWMFSRVPMFQNIGPGAYKPGLDNVLALSRMFGSPHLGLRTIHIAGTNGKGSTASTLAAILTAAGYRTGLYTSPHLVDFRERIRIDGEMIPQDDVVDFIRRYRAADSGINPSFFELTTVMAFEHFARRNVDIAVIETGLGGRLDSTNIITPEISIITNISMDHTALLGDTPRAIAGEKAGIIKDGVPVVVGRAEGEVREVFAAEAARHGSAIDFACDSLLYDSATAADDHITYCGTPWGEIRSELCGACQPENANTVMHAMRVAFPDIPAEAVARGFASVTEMTGLRGRWTTLARNPRIICDTGHNPGGWEYLGDSLAKLSREGRLHVVLGFVNDKDIDTILRRLPREATYYFATPSVSRGRDSRSLAEHAAGAGIQGIPYPDVRSAYMAARNAAAPGDTIFVGGSTFVVADLLSTCL